MMERFTVALYSFGVEFIGLVESAKTFMYWGELYIVSVLAVHIH